MSFHTPAQYRIDIGLGLGDEFHGSFLIPFESYKLQVIASNGEGWEHISVSLWQSKKTPSWKMMCFIKDLFWGPEDVVVQFHPRQSEYVNFHAGCLHLWRPCGIDIATPSPILVGPL